MAACTPAGRAVKADGKVLVSSRPCLPRVTSALARAVIFSCAFLVPELEGAQFRVLGPDQPVTAVVGEDVVLPCRLSPRLNAENMDVLWFWSTSSIHVHIYRSGLDDYSLQNPQYRGRTELSKEGLSVGNVSLRILSTRLSDEGQYRCRVQDGDSYEEASVELQVAESIFPKEYPWKVAFFVTLAACFASLVVICLLISRLRAQSRELVMPLVRSCRPIPVPQAAHKFLSGRKLPLTVIPAFPSRETRCRNPETCLGAAVEEDLCAGGRRYRGVGLCLSMGLFPCAAGGGCTSRWTRTRRTHCSSSRMVGRAYGGESRGKRCQITPRDTTTGAASWARRDSPPGDTSGMWMWGRRKEGSGHWGWPRSPRRGRGRSTWVLETGSGVFVTITESIGL
ncbi:uncharacterized protein LOC135317617 isoform X3 [Phalacrocorax carbo]|uniref:uncharacterized protein LOC135317617 isoform X3 n=1 Tax=Phalacrocorax carbo TaxID=9209 RepID=UPI00311A86D2